MPWIKWIFVAVLICNSCLYGGGREDMRHFIEEVFKEVIENMEADESVIARYFAPDYVQHVDGHTLGYADFVRHMLLQKQHLCSAQMTIDRCIVEDDAINTVHRVHVVKKDGTKATIKVIAYFEVADGKIVLCDELTYLLQGATEDKKLGSIN